MNSYIHLLPVIAILGYVNYPKDLRINPITLYYISIAHNSLLIGFSVWTAVSLASILYKYGIVYQSTYYFQHEDFDRIIYYFYLSKYYEFIDTFLLYLKGTTPGFLQKYHHIGALITWHITYTCKMDSVWIPSLGNSVVHTIMYSYYLATLLKLNHVKRLKIYITSLQLMQFIVLTPYSIVVYYPPNETVSKYIVQLLCNVYVFGLVALFGHFYYQSYVAKIN
jgi:GNS1/SUR4 family